MARLVIALLLLAALAGLAWAAMVAARLDGGASAHREVTPMRKIAFALLVALVAYVVLQGGA